MHLVNTIWRSTIGEEKGTLTRTQPNLLAAKGEKEKGTLSTESDTWEPRTPKTRKTWKTRSTNGTHLRDTQVPKRMQ